MLRVSLILASAGPAKQKFYSASKCEIKRRPLTIRIKDTVHKCTTKQ